MSCPLIKREQLVRAVRNHNRPLDLTDSKVIAEKRKYIYICDLDTNVEK